MTLQEAIYKRKTTRSFELTELDADILGDIEAFAKTVKPLNDDIHTEMLVVSKDKIKTILPWKAPHNLVIFSEIKDGCYENVGFIMQQVDLYMQSIGLGCCWVGYGKPASDGGEMAIKPSAANMEFIIFITFGKAKGSPHREISGFKRKTMSEISDTVDERLESARLAPSGKNEQPWRFVHDGGYIHAYCVNPGRFKSEKDGHISRINMGCALAHLYVAYPDTFRMDVQETAKTIDGQSYISSFQI